jgi:cyclopropane fatty-acyl-phospholipid synthase-like methyltransferase
MPRQGSWDERYRSADRPHTTAPVEFLVDNINLLPVGKVLDLAMGEGRNALFLAEQGFAVTGIDSSEVAVQRCNDLAQERGLTLHTIVADLTDFALPKGRGGQLLLPAARPDQRDK